MERRNDGKLLRLFQQAEMNLLSGEYPKEVLQGLVDRIMLLGLSQVPLDNGFKDLVQAFRSCPNGYDKVMRVVCERLISPTGRRFLVMLFERTGKDDAVLKEALGEIRKKAITDWDIDTLETLAPVKHLL